MKRWCIVMLTAGVALAQTPQPVVAPGGGNGTGAVASVAGKTGTVEVNTADLATSRLSATSTTITLAAGAVNHGQSTVHGTSATIARASGTDSGTFYIGYTAAGARGCYYGAGITIANWTLSGMTCASGTPPTRGFSQVGTVAVISGVPQTPVDTRGDVAVLPPAPCGMGLVTTGDNCDVDTTVVVRKLFGSGDPTTIAAARGDFYTDTGDNSLHECTNAAGCSASGHWTAVGGGGTTPDLPAEAMIFLHDAPHPNGADSMLGGNVTTIVRDYALIPTEPKTVTTAAVQIVATTASGRVAIGIANASGTLLATANCDSTSAGQVACALSSSVALAKNTLYYIRLAASDGTITIATSQQNGDWVGAFYGSSRIAQCANNGSFSGGVITLPSTCGTKSALGNTYGRWPWVTVY